MSWKRRMQGWTWALVWRSFWPRLVSAHKLGWPECRLTPSFILTGKDATEAFKDVGHSDEVREILEGLYIGDFESSTVSPFSAHRDNIF